MFQIFKAMAGGKVIFMSNTILEIQGLKKYFPIKKGLFSKTVANVKAVDNISLKVSKGETLGLVGESGCGKSTTGRVILRLHEPTDGKIYFSGKDITGLSLSEMREQRRDMQVIFQDPYASLNPRMKVNQVIKEAFKIHGLHKGREDEEVESLLQLVGIRPDQKNRYPHEFSGGQRQRIGFARALALQPKLIICDEPVSALDVSIQAQILNLMKMLQQKFNLTYLFISHDLSVVRHMSDKIVVMYLGQIVETAKADDLYTNPLHPYTKALISSIPVPKPGFRKEALRLKGDVPSPVNIPSGCRFHSRCPIAQEICSKYDPEYRDYGEEHMCACHFAGKI